MQDKLFISTSLSIFFPRVINIRRYVFDFEDALKDKYFTPPLMVSIGDEIKAEIPRFTFTSKNRHSQINVSQVNLSLNVSYDDKFTKDYNKCKSYLLERVKLIYPILEKVTNGKLCYAGLIHKIHYLVDDKGGKEHLRILADKFFSKGNYDEKIHDLNFKYTVSKNNANYINLLISNVRNFSVQQEVSQSPIRLSDDKVESVGIQIILDVNDRRAYNEVDRYISSIGNVNKLFEISGDIITNKLDAILKSGKIFL